MLKKLVLVLAVAVLIAAVLTSISQPVKAGDDLVGEAACNACIENADVRKLRKAVEMGNREVPFDEKERCDRCGAIGAFDFMGDLLCAKCAEELIPSAEEE